ncbi:MAG TPA: ISL3 family transposase [Polyangiaceae bacterium]|nr:ISL3 family transposase [Polyangiaceae bacterium]
MPKDILAQQYLLPEMKLLEKRRGPRGGVDLVVEMTSELEVCPRCATPSRSVYDRRWATVRDEPVRGAEMRLLIHKRRFSCRPCGRPFTEPVNGVRKRSRTTERYGKAVLQACEDYVDLKTVRRRFRCSAGFLYSALYRHLELKRRTRQYEWPERIGLDEHYFRRDKKLDVREFVTMVVDHTNGRLLEVADGRRGIDVEHAVRDIAGRDNVRFVTLDLCDPYKRFAKEHFPNAQLVADKFHVLRLPQSALMRRRKLAEDGKNSPYLRLLLLKPRRLVPYKWRQPLFEWVCRHPSLKAVYEAKEALHGFYRTRSRKQAAQRLRGLCDTLAHSELPELQTLRSTLLRWRKEILAYWYCRLTNARTEGFNNKAKLVKRRAYGYVSFEHYRLRLLNSCSG